MAEHQATSPNRRRRSAIIAAAVVVTAAAGATALGVLIAYDLGRGASSHADSPPRLVAPSAPNDFCSHFPALPRTKPSAATTGVRPGARLRTISSTSVTQPGAVIDQLWIKGTLTISANDVTVERSKIEAAASGWFGIVIGDGVTGTRIIGNEIWGDGGGYVGIYARLAGSSASPTFVCGNHLHNWENDITDGPNMMVQANFIDAMQNNGSDRDADGIEDYYGGNTKFWGNNIMAFGPDGSSTAGINSAINITATRINISNVQINGNWLGGGGYTMDLDEQGASATNVSVTNNVWYSSPAPRYGPMGIHGSNIVSVWSGNTWSNGRELPK